MASKAVKEAKIRDREEAQSGTGIFLMQNISHATIMLPKPSLDNPPQIHIQPGGVFRGDSYHRHALAPMGLIRIREVENMGDNLVEEPKFREEIDPNTGAIRTVSINAHQDDDDDAPKHRVAARSTNSGVPE